MDSFIDFSKEDLKFIKDTNPELYEQLQRNKKSSTKLKSKSVMRVENPELYYQLYPLLSVIYGLFLPLCSQTNSTP